MDVMDDAFRNKIRTDLIQPNYVNEITEFIKSRTSWRSYGVFFETFSKLLLGCGTIITFSAGVYSNTNLSFIAGTVSTASLVCLQFSGFAFLSEKKATKELNSLLEQLKIDSLPDFAQIEMDQVLSKKTLNEPEMEIEPQIVNVIQPEIVPEQLHEISIHN